MYNSKSTETGRARFMQELVSCLLPVLTCNQWTSYITYPKTPRIMVHSKTVCISNSSIPYTVYLSNTPPCSTSIPWGRQSQCGRWLLLWHVGRNSPVCFALPLCKKGTEFKPGTHEMEIYIIYHHSSWRNVLQTSLRTNTPCPQDPCRI